MVSVQFTTEIKFATRTHHINGNNVQCVHPVNNNSHLDHWSTAALICSWLIMSQSHQLFRTCFRWKMCLIFQWYTSCCRALYIELSMGFRSGEPLQYVKFLLAVDLQRCYVNMQMTSLMMCINHFRLFSKEHSIHLYKFYIVL